MPVVDARFIHNQMTGTPNFILACFGLCQGNANASILGTTNLCATSPQGNYVSNYTIGNGENLVWLHSSNLRLLASSNTSAMVELINPALQEPQWIQIAVFSSTGVACVQLSNRIAIWVGEPNPLRMEAHISSCDLVVEAFSTSATDFQWSISPTIAYTLITPQKIAINGGHWVGLGSLKLAVTCQASNVCNAANPFTITTQFTNPDFPLSPILRTKNLTFSVFPNPTSGNVVLGFENLAENLITNQPHSTNNISTIFVSNSLGSKVLSINNPILTQHDNKTYTTLNLSNLPDGLYFVTVVFENGSVASQKIMVQKGVVER